MATISLGSIYNQGGKTIVGGGSSNLDTDSLINSLVEAKRLPAVRLESNIEKNTAKIDALNELSGILETFRDAANFLRNPPGVGNTTENIFNYRSATVSSNTGSASNYLSATVETGTDPSSYSMTVDQLATKQTRVTNTFGVADQDTQVVGGGGPFNAGTLTLGPSGITIELTDGDTINQMLSKINAVKADSGVEVNSVKVADGSYRLTFKATTTGTDQNFDFTAANPAFFSGGLGFFSETDAVNANVTIDGTQVTRQTNNISDLVDGITFSATQETPPGTTLTVGVTADTELAKNAVLNFVDAYNEFRVFASRQTETNDDGERVSEAVIGSNNSLRSLINSVGSEISAIVSGVAGNNSLDAIGIELTDFAGDDETPFTRNILQVDDGKLDAAFASDFEAVRKVFEFNAVADNPNLVVFSRTNGLNTNDISYNIDQTNGVYEATVDGTTYTLESSPLTSGGVSLTGPDGSPLAGLNVLYTDTDDVTVNLSLTQGVADRLYNIMSVSLNDEDGIVAQEIDSLDERNVRLEEDIARIDTIVENYRFTLLERFSALEAAISSVNSILQLLDAQAEARSA
ncbi:MAG: flagellar filament capping protein FliD [Alphaproteobacteria bacterium]|nr:flagellar filament capping protein FliD [Alphaproteobacteria bacterium]